MAQGDKLVKLDGLKAVYDKVNGDVGTLNTAVSGLSNVFQYIQEDITDLNTDVDGLKSAISLLDVYGSDNRTPWVNGTGYSGALTVVCNDGIYTTNGVLTGTGETHYNIFSQTDSLPAGILPGMKLQVTHICDSNNVTFRLYNRVSGSNVLICEIAGNGSQTVTVDENATGMIVRLSYKNGNTYTNTVSKPYIFGTLTKQQTIELVNENAQSINSVDSKVDSMKEYMPTAGNKQLVNAKNVQIIKARVSDTTGMLVADNNYTAFIIPATIEAQKTYWAKIFADSVTLDDIKLYTFNTVNVGSSIAVDVTDSYGKTTKRSRVQTTASASYFVLAIYLLTGTAQNALNGLVIAQNTEVPTEYQPYYIPVDDAIKNGQLSPDCVHVGTDNSYYPYTNINTAVLANPSGIVKVSYGTYETEVTGLTTNKILIGEDADLCKLTGTNKDYDTPPIEISGGMVKNFTIEMTNNPSAEHKGYCIHSDDSSCEDNSLIVENCKFVCTGQHAIGMGIYPGETVVYKNCEFIFLDEEAEPTHAPFFAHNSGAYDGLATVRFENCIFRGSGYAIKLSSYSSNCAMQFEFIDCTFASNTLSGDEMVWTDYVTGETHDQSKLHVFTGKMPLLPTSHGNNVSIANYSA